MKTSSTCPPRSARISSGTRSSTPTRSSPGRRCRSWISTSRWSPTTTCDELPRSNATLRTPGLVLRLRVPNTGSMVELSSKFGCDTGEAVDLIVEAFRIGLVVEGLSFHVGSQCTNFDNFVQALNMAAAVMEEARSRGTRDQDSGYRRRIPGPLRRAREAVRRAGEQDQRGDSRGCSRRISRFWRSRAGFWWPRRRRRWRGSSAARSATGSLVTTSTTACITRFRASSSTIASITSRRSSAAKTEMCTVFGQTCDGMDTISQSEELPRLDIDDLVYSEDIGAYSNASATWFNGFAPAKVVHVNQ